MVLIFNLGEAWLIAITKTLRDLLPRNRGYLIRFVSHQGSSRSDPSFSHAPQAPYFMGKSKYPNGGYLTVHAAVGSMIDFYNVQFYNQDSSTYQTYQTLFRTSDGWASGTSVYEMAAKGIDLNKIVVGKPVTRGDVVNTGYIDVGPLAGMLRQGRSGGWNGGFMGWQFPSDVDGSWSKQLAQSF